MSNNFGLYLANIKQFINIFLKGQIILECIRPTPNKCILFEMLKIKEETNELVSYQAIVKKMK